MTADVHETHAVVLVVVCNELFDLELFIFALVDFLVFPALVIEFFCKFLDDDVF